MDGAPLNMCVAAMHDDWNDRSRFLSAKVLQRAFRGRTC